MREGPGGRVYYGVFDEGIPIGRVQDALTPGDPPRVRGLLDGPTRDRLANWQGEQGLHPTGVIDAATWQRLFNEEGPSLQSRVLSAAAWMMGMGPIGRRVDPALGLRWGAWGASSRSGRLRAQLVALRALPSPSTDPVMARAMSLSPLSQVAFWWVQRRSPRAGWLPRKITPEIQKVQMNGAIELWGDFPTEVDADQEREIWPTMLLRIFLDSHDPDEVLNSPLPRADRLIEDVEELEAATQKGHLLRRDPREGWVDGDPRRSCRFGLC